jgi:hypothetical protein
MATKKDSTAKKKPVAKKKATPKKEAVILDPKKQYDFVVEKESKHLKKGVYHIDGVMAQLLIDKGLGSVK